MKRALERLSAGLLLLLFSGAFLVGSWVLIVLGWQFVAGSARIFCG